MIPIHELQIGSWVILDNCPGEIIEMDSFDSKILIRNGAKTFIYNSDYGLIEPIPLTEEWFRKFGFLKEGPDDYWYNVAGDTVLQFDEDGRIWVYNSDNGSTSYLRNIKYVHQLQLFWAAVTGEKLEVK